jgi:hypothetical protein
MPPLACRAASLATGLPVPSRIRRRRCPLSRLSHFTRHCCRPCRQPHLRPRCRSANLTGSRARRPAPAQHTPCSHLRMPRLRRPCRTALSASLAAAALHPSPNPRPDIASLVKPERPGTPPAALRGDGGGSRGATSEPRPPHCGLYARLCASGGLAPLLKPPENPMKSVKMCRMARCL